ncbi:dolichol-phosphate mannosyltransferase [Shimia isoporae]|uniref:Dolichol-phosphate mannosyltransferase n=1 Tax=Shimia isoporae TaxID=647720 RepID=A0A4R1N2Z1_9RHOB|nr:glycosyltransferase family 2 protein [Shimia isoporae]TCL00608.1 dolichol-phosphate mannosyltransferase [Shimia isoporae]
MSDPATSPTISVVVPAKNEKGNLPELIRDIQTAFEGHAEAIEIIIVDDGSDDGSPEVVKAMTTDMPNLRLLSHPTSGGQSAAVHSGTRAARGRIVCTLDGDGQNPPLELPNLVAPLLAPDASDDLGLVAGQRVNRQDTLSKKLASKAANAIRSFILKDKTRDTGCGLKAFKREAFLDLPYFDHMHRYLPALFSMNGYSVAHVDVTHRQRGAGRSNYSNFQRALVGLVDLFGVAWLIRRRKKARALEITPGTESTK